MEEIILRLKKTLFSLVYFGSIAGSSESVKEMDHTNDSFEESRFNFKGF